MRWLLTVSSSKADGAEAAADILRSAGFGAEVIREWIAGTPWQVEGRPKAAGPVRLDQGPFEAKKALKERRPG
jgi:hypothetical protein